MGQRCPSFYLERDILFSHPVSSQQQSRSCILMDILHLSPFLFFFPLSSSLTVWMGLGVPSPSRSHFLTQMALDGQDAPHPLGRKPCPHAQWKPSLPLIHYTISAYPMEVVPPINCSTVHMPTRSHLIHLSEFNLLHSFSFPFLSLFLIFPLSYSFTHIFIFFAYSFGFSILFVSCIELIFPHLIVFSSSFCVTYSTETQVSS